MILHADISAFGDEVLDHSAVAINSSGMKNSETIRIRVVDSNVIVVSQNSSGYSSQAGELPWGCDEVGSQQFSVSAVLAVVLRVSVIIPQSRDSYFPATENG